MSQKILEEQMKNIIQALKPGTEFMLKDIIINPPANLGVKLSQGVESGEIENVIFVKRGGGDNKYRKI